MLNFPWFVFLQIAAESLPISSSGHLQLCLEWIKAGNHALFTSLSFILERPDVLFALHFPTVIIIALFYLPRFLRFILFSCRSFFITLKTIGYVIVANCLTVICYVGIQQSGISVPLSIGFLVTFFLLLSTAIPLPRRFCLDMKRFALLGLVQGIAVVPGISRFAAVYAAGHWLGLSGSKAFDVAWMLQFPLILAAALLGWAQLFLNHESLLLISPSGIWAMALGMLVGFIGLFLMSLLAACNRLWIMALYIIIPFAISLWYGF